MIINIFGQPGSGKTTLAEKLSSDLKIRYPDHQIINIDGDFVRKATNNFDYSDSGRRANLTIAYHIAHNIIIASKIDANFKPIVIIAMVSPFESIRKELREECEVIEVFLESSRLVRKENHVEFYERPNVGDCIAFHTDDYPVENMSYSIIDKYIAKKYYEHKGCKAIVPQY